MPEFKKELDCLLELQQDLLYHLDASSETDINEARKKYNEQYEYVIKLGNIETQ